MSNPSCFAAPSRLLVVGSFDGTLLRAGTPSQISKAREYRLPSEVRSFRMSTSTLGLGFVEAIDDNTLLEIARTQPTLSAGNIHGDAIRVPILESGNALRVGRFGWKCQHGSLVSFAADAYLNEMGITSPLQPIENSSNGESIAAYDLVPDPEDDGADVEVFARFMRATKVPPRDIDLAATQEDDSGPTNTVDFVITTQEGTATGASDNAVVRVTGPGD